MAQWPICMSMMTGADFEQMAASYLVREGFRVLARNWASKFGEVDIIAKDLDGTLVFVEVRQRISIGHGGAAASVTRAKQKKLILTAKSYIAGQAQEPSIRFDVIAFEGEQMEHIRGAFLLD